MDERIALAAKIYVELISAIAKDDQNRTLNIENDTAKALAKHSFELANAFAEVAESENTGNTF